MDSMLSFLRFHNGLLADFCYTCLYLMNVGVSTVKPSSNNLVNTSPIRLDGARLTNHAPFCYQFTTCYITLTPTLTRKYKINTICTCRYVLPEKRSHRHYYILSTRQSLILLSIRRQYLRETPLENDLSRWNCYASNVRKSLIPLVV
jgi:hypothetical protein